MSDKSIPYSSDMQPLGPAYFTDKLFSGIQLVMVGSAAGMISIGSGIKDLAGKPELILAAKHSAMGFALGLFFGGLALCTLFGALFARDKYLGFYDFARQVTDKPRVVVSSPSAKTLFEIWRAARFGATYFAGVSLICFGWGALLALDMIWNF